MKNGLLILLTLAFVPFNGHGQKQDVYDELTDSFSYGKKAMEYANATLDYIRKCYQQTTTEEVQYYARKARNEIDYAKTQVGYAESDASEAESEADDINCDDAEDEANYAEGNFYSAKRVFDDAYTYLRRAEYSDSKEEIEHNLRRAKSYVEDGIRNLNYALKDLNEAVDELNECQ